MTMGSRGAFPAEEAMTAFSALHLLRNYNQLLAPPGGNLVGGYHPYSLGSPTLPDIHQIHRENHQGIAVNGFEISPVLGAFQPYSHLSITPPSPRLSEPNSRNALAVASTFYSRRPRGEKKPIPDEQKDDRYYERRKRNNQAAKKSRDARKLREDQIALRATILEHENAVLRAQILTLREEAQSLRQLLLIQRKAPSRALPLISDEDFKSNGSSDKKSDEPPLPLSLKDENSKPES